MLLAAGGLMDQPMAAAPTEFPNLNSVIANPFPAAPLQTEEQQNEPDEMNVFQGAGEAAPNPLPQIFRYGPLQLRPHADYSLTYGDGIQYAPGTSQAMMIQQLSPGLLANIGTHWALNYTPTFQFYSSDKFHNSVNQSFALIGGVDYDDWRFGVSQTAVYSSAPTVATAAQTDQSGYGTSFTASRPLTSNLTANLGLNQSIALVSGFEDTYDWSTLDGVDYQFWPRLTAGIGVGAGYTLVENNTLVQNSSQLGGAENLDQTHEELTAHVNWRATDKISFQISGGLDDRQFQTAGSSDSLSPIFGATIQYQLFKDTQVSLVAARSTGASDYYLAAQEIETTSVALNLSQQLYRRFAMGLSVAYATSDYGTAVNAASAGAANRSDDQVSFNARLSHPFFKRGTWAVFYQYSSNSSSQGGFSFDSSQTGIDISYSF
jgi:hypothetical protein